jgi:tetratricopeptide (TPR) repeat protein
LAVAARAVLADASLRDGPCMTCLQRAEALARRSIALDTQHPEPYLYLATALGYEARIVGSLRARFARYPEQAKEAIDRALAVAPNDSWSLAAAGTWHIEVVRNGGSLLARALFGARVETGEDYLRRAVAAEPENLVIRFQRALLLSGLDFEVNREAATLELAAATMTEPRTAYERALKARGRSI